MSKISQRLSQGGIVITDGATGTMLQRAGLPAGAPSELWILEKPDEIRKLHRSYFNAGSDAVLTNTFGGSRLKLETNKLGDKVTQINRIGAQLARDVSAGKGIVFGDIGPTGKIMEPYGPLTYSEAVDVFAEQAAALAEGGVDGFIIETMSDMNEAKAAIEGVRRVSNLYIAVTMSFDTRGRTMMGVKPANAAKEFLALGIDATGANCGRTLEETLTAIREMRQLFPYAVLWAKPNAGLPHMEGSDTVYDVTPEVMAEYAQKFAEQRVNFFGGCCGSTPEHIQATAKILRH